MELHLTRRQIPEDRGLVTVCCDNPKFSITSPSTHRNHQVKYHKISGNVKESELTAMMAYRGHNWNVRTMLAVISTLKKETQILPDIFHTNWHNGGYSHVEFGYTSLHVTSKRAVT